MADIFIPELDVPVIFRQQPVSLPGDLRPVWRISVLMLLLRKCCTGGKSSLRRLHVLSWAVRSSEASTMLLNAIDGEIPPDAVIVRIEPALNRAVDFAIGEGLLRRGTKDRVELTPEGRELAESILADKLVLAREKRFADEVRYSVTEGFVKSMFEQGESS